MKNTFKYNRKRINVKIKEGNEIVGKLFFDSGT